MLFHINIIRNNKC